MIDLAVPRDVEPQVAELSDIYLYTVDDMREVIERTCVCVPPRQVKPMRSLLPESKCSGQACWSVSLPTSSRYTVTLLWHCNRWSWKGPENAREGY